ncbi:MAG TPA: sigma-70 family RNA polymerase sigma factor [Terriglobales bacterium]|nr:sigma-70 family RNA polymerase sigma factor [Terriglobales bacterium]
MQLHSNTRKTRTTGKKDHSLRFGSLPLRAGLVHRKRRNADSNVCGRKQRRLRSALSANHHDFLWWLSDVQNGNREALAILFRRHARAIRGLAFRVLRDATEADDLLQDIFLAVPKESASFDGSKGSARFWLMQVAYRRAISRRRYLNCRHFYSRINLEDAAIEISIGAAALTEFEESIDAKFGNGALDKILGELSENQRLTLRLFFVEGYTLDEIAIRLGQTRGNVKNHYFRSLEKLRKALFGGKLPGERAV